MGLRMQKIENVRSSRLAELGVLAHVEARKLVAATMGRHYLVGRNRLGIDLRQIAFFHGHFCIGQEPRTGRKPIYLTVVREPVDRFLSYFYYRLDQLATMKRENRLGGSHPMIDQFERPPALPMEFLELLFASGAQNWRDSQVRYFSSRGTFEAARAVIVQYDVITAPMTQLDAFAKKVGEKLDLGQLRIAHMNKGRSRDRATGATLSNDDADTIRNFFQEDQKLYDYVSEKF